MADEHGQVRDPAAHSEHGERRQRAVLWPLALIGGVVALVYAAPIFFNEVFFRRDISRYIHPILAQLRARIAAGELPLWNRGEFGGMPLLGDVTNSALYPPQLALLWMSPHRAITTLIVGHHLLAAVGMLLLLRRLGTAAPAAVAAGLCFSLSGYAVAMDNSMIYLVGMCWAPWVLWALDRLLERPSAGRTAVLASIFAFLFTSGELQLTYLSVLLSCAYLLVSTRPLRSGAAWLALAGSCALGLSAVQLLPLGSVIMASSRAGGLELAHAQVWALHPARLLELVVAHPFGVLSEQSFWGHALVNNPRHSTPWSNGLYVGAALPLLALLSPRDRTSYFLWALAGLSLLLAMGPHTPLDGWLRAVVPLWSAFRYPEKLMSVATLSLCLAAGRGVGRLMNPATDVEVPRRALWLFLGVGVLAGLAFALVWLSPAGPLTAIDDLLRAGRTRHVDRLEALVLLRTGLLRSALVLLCGVALLAFTRRAAPGHRLLQWGWPCLLLLDVATANARLIEVAPADLYTTPNALAAEISRQSDRATPQRVHRFRMSFRPPPQLPGASLNPLYHFWMRQTLEPKSGVEYDLRYSTGYSATTTVGFRRFWDAVGSVPDGRALDLTATAFLIDSLSTPRHRLQDGDREIARFEQLDARLLARGNPLPMARLVYQVERVASREAGRERLAAPDFDVRNAVVVSGPLPLASAVRTAEPVRFMEDGHSSVLLEAHAAAPALLVLAATHDANWRAFVDGEPAPIIRTNYLHQGVLLPAGTHRVRFEYRDDALALGALISAITLLGMLLSIRRSLLARGDHSEN